MLYEQLCHIYSYLLVSTKVCLIRHSPIAYNFSFCSLPPSAHPLLLSFFFLLIPRPPRSTLFPYTTLFRSALEHTGAAQLAAVRADEDELADVPGATVFGAFELTQEPLDAAGVLRPIARRAHARPAAQRDDLEPRVLPEHPRIRRPDLAPVERLDARVLHVALLALLRVAVGVEQVELPAEGRQLAELVAVPRAEQDQSRSRDDVSASRCSASGIEGGLLRLANLGDALRSQVEQLVQCVAVERRALGGRLHLDQPFAAGHDDVQVDLGTRVLHVVEVEQQLAAHDSERHRCDRVRKHAREASLAERARSGDVRSRDRRAARAAVGLEHVAVEPERPLAQRLEVEHRAQRAPDQTLDFDGAALLLAGAGLALHALAGRRREHRVLRRQPAPAGVAQPARRALVERGRAEHLRLALRIEHRPHRLLEVVE